MTTIQNTQNTVKRGRRMARERMDKSAATPIAIAAHSPGPIAPARANTESALLVDLLSRTEGATIGQNVEGTGWLPHTVRAALTGLKKKGHALTSDKPEGEARVYSVARPALHSDDGVEA
jgi:hypothetical protein